MHDDNVTQRVQYGVIACLVFIASALSGCWGRVETDDIAIISALALDLVTEGKVLLSVEILNDEALLAGAADITPSQAVSWVLQEEGNTVMNALLNLQRRTPRHLTLGQMSNIIVGQNVARDGIGNYLDFIAREGLVRRSALLTTCDSGAGLLMRPFLEDLPSLTLRGLHRHGVRAGKTVQVTVGEFLMKFSEPGIEPITMHTGGRNTQDVVVKRIGDPLEQENPAEKRYNPLESETNIPGMLSPESPILDPLREHGTSEEMPGMTIAIGIGVYRGDTLVGFLDGNDARGYLWLVGRVEPGAVIEVPDPFVQGKEFSVVVRKIRSSLSPQVEHGRPLIEADLDLQLEIAEIQHDIMLDSIDVRRLLEAAVSRAVESEIQNALRAVQEEFKSDIYGFGQLFYRYRTDTWDELQDSWNEEVFPQMKVNVTVRSAIRRHGSTLGYPGLR